MQTKGIDLDSTVVIRKDELLQDTWSPMLEEMDAFIKGLGFKDINISVTERQMHDDISLAAENCCTPLEMARLLLWFNEHKDDNAYIREVWDIMASCNTGADRIPAAVGNDCRVIHKTGTGFTPESGLPQYLSLIRLFPQNSRKL